MEDVFKDPVQLSKGINLNDLMTSQAEFHLDLDFKLTKNGIDLNEYGDMIPDAEDNDSDSEDIFEHIEKRTDEMMLSSPEYLNFEELAAKMVDLPCRPSGAVKVTILDEGSGELVPLDAEVTIHYAAYWEKAKIPFDSSLTMQNGNPIRISLGSGRCLPGLELALSCVRGPTARLLALLQPEVTWGLSGAPPRIRPEPALFVIVMYSVSDVSAQNSFDELEFIGTPGSDDQHRMNRIQDTTRAITSCLRFNSLPQEEQTKYTTTVRTVHELRGTASGYFHQKRYKRAISLYQQATHVLSLSHTESKQEKREIANLRIKLFVNLAVCYYKLNKPQRVIDMCENIDRIVDINTHCKALFYKGRACQMMGKLEEALEWFRKALKLEPNNKEIGSLLAEIDEKIKKSKEVEAKMWQRAFSAKPLEKRAYSVDEEFEKNAREMCGDLASRTEFTRVELPVGLLSDEVSCLSSIAQELRLRIEEQGQGRRKRVAIIKTVL